LKALRSVVRTRADPSQLRQFVAQLKAGTVVRLYQPVAEKMKRHVLIAAGFPTV
jgi:hypothetical protein